jgi:hypothetical protein
MIVPEEFVVQKFYQHAGYPKYVKSTNTYTGGCPVCREGSSWGRKSRCYYIPKDTKICCHNCGWYSKPIDWILEVEKCSYSELAQQVDECDYSYGMNIDTKTVVRPPTNDLPQDSINLFDKSQLKYYSNQDVVIQSAQLIVNRRLNTAINRPRSLYVSLSDPVHKNRLIIPFYDKGSVCSFYQTRTILKTDQDRPKYLSKQNSEKTLFNYDNVHASTENVFITEGPIDSFFIKNSVAVAGIQEKSKQTFTPAQRKQMDKLFLVQPVWVLDSQWLDNASLMKTKTLLHQGHCVFLWPKDIGQRFKDINDLCLYFNINQVTEKFLLDNTYCGLKGIVKLKQFR